MKAQVFLQRHRFFRCYLCRIQLASYVWSPTVGANAAVRTKTPPLINSSATFAPHCPACPHLQPTFFMLRKTFRFTRSHRVM
jgi:hypothetical protein